MMRHGAFSFLAFHVRAYFLVPRTLLIATGARASDIRLNDLIIGPRASRKWAPLDVMNRDVMNFNERATRATSLLASSI